MDNGARYHDIGSEFEITDAPDTPTSFAYGGVVHEWVPFENALMRRKITHVLLALLPLAVAACVYLTLRGAPVLAVASVAMLVTVPLGAVVQYYFHEAAK
jgi:hypothetical protein